MYRSRIPPSGGGRLAAHGRGARRRRGVGQVAVSALGQDALAPEHAQRQLAERRRRDDAAVVRAARTLDVDEHDVLRLVRWHDADERRDVFALLILAVRDDLRRAGLAGHRVAGDLGVLAGTLSDDVA